MKNNKKPIFYKLYFAILIVFVLGAVAVLITENAALGEYESVQPQYEAQRVFENFYFGDFSDFAEKLGKTELESVEEIKNGFAKTLENKDLAYAKSGIDENGSFIYTVTADGKAFSEFTLKKSGEKTRFGFEKYALSAITASKNVTVTVKAPNYCKVSVNGVEIGLDNATETGIETVSCSHMHGDSVGLKYNTYEIDGLYSEPTVTVTGRSGESNEVVYENGIYEAKPIYDKELENGYAEFVIGCAEDYAKYMQDDAPFSVLPKYFDRSSLYYRQISAVEKYFVVKHRSYSFEDVEATEFYAYDDDTFSCRVKFTQVLVKDDGESFRDSVDTTYYLRKINGKYLIYDSHGN